MGTIASGRSGGTVNAARAKPERRRMILGYVCDMPSAYIDTTLPAGRVRQYVMARNTSALSATTKSAAATCLPCGESRDGRMGRTFSRSKKNRRAPDSHSVSRATKYVGYRGEYSMIMNPSIMALVWCCTKMAEYGFGGTLSMP